MLLACLGLPGQLVYTVSVLYLEGVKRPQPGLFVIIAANILQVILCLALVDGLVTWGAFGGVAAMGITRTAMAVAIVSIVLLDRRARTFGVFGTLFPAWSDWKAQRRLGYANGLSNGMETMGFTVLMILAGHVSALQIGAFSVSLNLLATVFMAAVGIGGAGAVRIGSFRGAQQPAAARRAGWVALGLNTGVMIAAGIAVVAFAFPIARFYTTDPQLIHLVAGLMVVVALVMPVDGGQVVLASMLRGFNDGVGPTICHFISYILVMLPLGWLLALKLERGAQGLFEAVLIASIVSMAILAARYWWITRRL
jgi:MATE family multidrug resistance protein